MITIKFYIKQYLAEYLHGKFNDGRKGPIIIPSRYELYSLMQDLTIKKPEDYTIEQFNIEIALPCSKSGKSPVFFNHLSARSITVVSRRIKAMFWSELHSLMEDNKHLKGIPYKDTAEEFISIYQICTISAEGLVKNYYRWKRKCLEKQEKRKYFKKK